MVDSLEIMRRNLVIHLRGAHQDVESREALHPARFSWSPTNMPLANLEYGSADYTSQACIASRSTLLHTLQGEPGSFPR